jgi:hypothetical protein
MAKSLRLIPPARPQPTTIDIWPGRIASEFRPHETCFCIADELLTVNRSYKTLPEVVTYTAHQHQEDLILIAARSPREIHLALSLGFRDVEVARDFAHFQQQLSNDIRSTGQRPEYNRASRRRSQFARAFVNMFVEALDPAGLLDEAGRICRILGLWPDNGENESFRRWLNRSRYEVRKNTPDYRDLPPSVARGLLGTVAAACSEIDPVNDVHELLGQLCATLGMTLAQYQRRLK